MAIRKVARMGHPVLRLKARELTREEILSPEIRRFVQDLFDTMEEYGGIGIAAPQVHESISLAIIDYQEDEENPVPPTVVVNPKITVLDETRQGYWEGCLSVPEIRGLVYRPRKIRVDFKDLEAKDRSIVAEGFLATVFQHELDHLGGVLFVDRIEYGPGTSPIAFTEEYVKHLAHERAEDIGELDD